MKCIKNTLSIILLRNHRNTFIFILFVFLYGCQHPRPNTQQKLKALFASHSTYIAQGFDFPVGKPNAKGYYNAQKFGKNNHLGDDWNGVKGGNTDLGDSIYSIAHGYVRFAKDVGGGWGKVIRVVHQLPNGKLYESLYAHCDSIAVKPQTWVKKGQFVGTIGNANGQYYAHLHLEIRDDISLPLGPGYATQTKGYLAPSGFIRTHRNIPPNR